MQVNFKNRDFTVRDPLTANIQVVEYSFLDKGGPYRGQLTATGSPFAIWALANDLRCPVEIYDDLGSPCWWGYVHEVEITAGVMTFKASLSDMFNKVSVAYTSTTVGSSAVGQKKTTTPITDINSISEYGTRGIVGRRSNSDGGEYVDKYRLPERGDYLLLNDRQRDHSHNLPAGLVGYNLLAVRKRSYPKRGQSHSHDRG
jgi:hypothetical protein